MTASKKVTLDALLKEITLHNVDGKLTRDEAKQKARECIQQFTPDYKQDFPSKQAVFKADAQTELIAKMLKVLQ